MNAVSMQTRDYNYWCYFLLMPLLTYISEHLGLSCCVLVVEIILQWSQQPTYSASSPLCLPARNDTVNQKTFGRDEKTLTTLQLLNCTWHFVTDDILRHPFSAYTNFYLFNKHGCSEILKLEINSFSFHQQWKHDPGVQGQQHVLSAGTSCRKLLAWSHLHEEEMDSPACTHREETWQRCYMKVQ